MKTRWASGTLGTTEHTLVSCKNNSSITIDKFIISNIGGSTTTYDLYHVPKNCISCTATAIGFEVSIQKKDFAEIDGPFYMIPGDQIIVKAGSSSSINIFAYGTEQQ